MSEPRATPPLSGSGRGPADPCDNCWVILFVAFMAGCYVAGFGYSGWLAVAIGLNVWILGALLLAVRPKRPGDPDQRQGRE